MKNLLNDMVIKEGDSLEATARLMENNLDLKDIPLIIFTAGKLLRTLPGWEKSQKSLLKLSANSTQIIIEDSNHISIHLEHTNKIILSIKELIDRNK